MEAIRRNFFNGIQDDERKISCIKWAKVLAPKKHGGLGVSSFYALNRALLLKWFSRLYALEVDKECNVAVKMNAPVTSSFRRAVRGGVESSQLSHILDILGSALRMCSSSKGVLECVFYTTWWSIWNFRNLLLFAAKKPRKEVLFDDIVMRSYVVDFKYPIKGSVTFSYYDSCNDELRMAIKEVLCDNDKERHKYEEALIAITVEESLKRLERLSFTHNKVLRSRSNHTFTFLPQHTKAGYGSGFIPVAEYGADFAKASGKGKAKKAVRLLYSGRNHYDLLV
ncbi:ovarian tumor, otubain [Tanacetum coccineum]